MSTATPRPFDAEAVRALAHLTDDELGHSEEDVKTGAKAKACHNKDMVCMRIVVGASKCCPKP